MIRLVAMFEVIGVLPALEEMSVAPAVKCLLRRRMIGSTTLSATGAQLIVADDA